MSGIRSKQERKMATQNPNRLRTNCPGGSLTLGGDTTVNRLGFGAMRLCGPGVWGEPLDRPGAKRVLMRAVELGITLVDTADAYGPEVNERFIAETLYPYPKGLIIATKGGLRRPRREAWENNGRPEHLRAACEASLRRLKLERIDIYQLHAPDPQVPLDESVGALAELQSEGKIRHIGLSNVSVNELCRAQRIAPIVSVQNRYNFSDRSSEDVLAECEKGGLAFLPWHPLAAGGDAAGGGALGRVARRRGATPVQVAIAWLLARSPVIVLIPGTSSVAHPDENVAAVRILLSTEDLHELS
ncbi:MAG TPA: aldo/keto reductase [Bradyrhizobium sp.]|nr:aldo/keto reductase [Bradyrhizobium sp.]